MPVKMVDPVCVRGMCLRLAEIVKQYRQTQRFVCLYVP